MLSSARLLELYGGLLLPWLRVYVLVLASVPVLASAPVLPELAVPLAPSS